MINDITALAVTTVHMDDAKSTRTVILQDITDNQSIIKCSPTTLESLKRDLNIINYNNKLLS